MKLQRSEVRFAVTDIKRSAEFYSNTLGLTATLMWPEASPRFAILEAGGVRLQLELGTVGAAATLWIDVDDIDALHVRVQPLARIDWGPAVYSYGRKEFSFSDPDNNHIILSAVSSAAVDCVIRP